MEWDITEAQALAGCYQAGYTWGGLYELFHRVSCWCCPLQSLKELRNLRKHFPDIWSEFRTLDDRAIAQFGWSKAYGKFRKYESVRMLEVRFDFETEWEAIGGKPNTKAFHNALNLRYQEYFIKITTPKSTPNLKAVMELLSYITSDDLKMLHMEEANLKRIVHSKFTNRTPREGKKRRRRKPNSLRPLPNSIVRAAAPLAHSRKALRL